MATWLLPFGQSGITADPATVVWDARQIVWDSGRSILRVGDGSTTGGVEIATAAQTITYKASGPFTGFLQSDNPIWLGANTTTNSSLPFVNVSRDVVDGNAMGPNYHCFSDSTSLTLSNDKAYNSYDARVTIEGAGLANHYAAFQVGVVKSDAGTVTNVFNFYCDLNLTGGTVSNLYGLFVNQPTVTGGATLGRVVGLLFNGIPRDYGNPANPNYLFYSNGSGGTAAPAYTAGLFTAANVVASATEITPGAMFHANTPDGTAVGIRIQQQGQNWWDWRMSASQTYFSLFNAIGGGSGTEWLRIAANPGHLSPGSVNAQDCGTDALPWRTIHADTGLSIQGIKVVGTQQAAIPNPTGGATVDAESRTAIDAILAALEAHGLIAT